MRLKDLLPARRDGGRTLSRPDSGRPFLALHREIRLAQGPGLEPNDRSQGLFRGALLGPSGQRPARLTPIDQRRQWTEVTAKRFG